MNLAKLGWVDGDYSYEYPTDISGNALVQEPGYVATSTQSYNWLTQLLNPITTVANNYLTQREITRRQQQQIQFTATAGGGISPLYLLGGAAILLMVMKK